MSIVTAAAAELPLKLATKMPRSFILGAVGYTGPDLGAGARRRRSRRAGRRWARPARPGRRIAPPAWSGFAPPPSVLPARVDVEAAPRDVPLAARDVRREPPARDGIRPPLGGVARRIRVVRHEDGDAVLLVDLLHLGDLLVRPLGHA